MPYQNYFPVKKLIKNSYLTERTLSSQAKLSRSALRSVITSEENITASSLTKLSKIFNREVEILASPKEISSEFSTVATCYKVERDGVNSWKIHFMDFVDCYRKTLDPRLILIPPPKNFDKKLLALLASITKQLCIESGIDTPSWADKGYFLNTPWFVSEMEGLKATSLIESPMPFRNNNIFVLENFLSRA